MPAGRPFYITTPIYYVNDRPHLGHVYTSVVADAAARLRRLRGEDAFLLSGTDEHAAKVVETARENGVRPQEWADRNAVIFRETAARFAVELDDFIRTSEPRHKAFAQQVLAELRAGADVYLGEYEGWYDHGEEEYVPEARAAELDFRSPVSGRPLVRRKEENWFFRLSAYQEVLLARLAEHPEAVLPAARRNEVIGRIRQGLHDVPISRTGGSDWGVPFPGAPGHQIYVWVEALLSYVTPVATPERRRYWPASVHLIAKDILWFHAVIWPALLLALHKVSGSDWLALPRTVYCHSWWISEGQKMSKSLGNFVDLEKLESYASDLGLDALRWFLVTQGPLGTVDRDFAQARLLEVYNADLANSVGNCLSRIVNMTQRFCAGRLPRVAGESALRAEVEALLLAAPDPDDVLGVGEITKGIDLVRRIDAFIEATQPFKLAKQPGSEVRVAEILYACAEAFRLASLRLWPAMPGKMEEVWRRLGGAEAYAPRLAGRGRGELDAWSRWGGLPAGAELRPGEPLFPRREAV
jgi:methionyl-tRNA synthetase